MILELVGEAVIESCVRLTAPLRRGFVAFAQRKSPVVPSLVVWGVTIGTMYTGAAHANTWWGAAMFIIPLPTALILSVAWVHARAGEYDAVPRAKRYRRIRAGDPDAG
jgi:hypothetical protein